MTREMSRPKRLKMPCSASRSRMSTLIWVYCEPSSRISRCLLHSVEPSGPKKYRRISLSMPTTCMPSRAKCRAASDPIRPAEPVTSATLTTVQLAGLPESDRRPLPVHARPDAHIDGGIVVGEQRAVPERVHRVRPESPHLGAHT